MKAKIYVLIMFVLILFCQCKKHKTNDMNGIILINHIGYETDGAKRLIFQTKESGKPDIFKLINRNGEVVYSGVFTEGGVIANWYTGAAFAGDFSEFNSPGDYKAQVNYLGTIIESEFFSIHKHILPSSTLDLLISGINSQRNADVYEERDKQMSFFGDRTDIVDVSGGWYDASGDRSKYLSHLSYANFMNPQQAPMIVWNFLEAAQQLERVNFDTSGKARYKMVLEAIHGADWLVRMQDAEGYFYINVFDNWSWDPSKREICAYIGQEGYKNDNYQAGYREGGGMAIAALARAAANKLNGEFSAETYLLAAKNGFHHLEKNNLQYIADGKENIIDDYCALMAATELYYATSDEIYLNAARKRMNQLTDRVTDDDNVEGYWRADDNNLRPYFHAAEAGLPIISLVRYLEVEKDILNRNKAIQAIAKAVNFELSVTSQVNNPFGYARQYVKATNEEEKRTAFFIPQNNETGYWWQGENARLASLATALYMAQPYINESKRSNALVYASNQINWILGLNPYDMCMLDGIGRNNPKYTEGDGELNVKGCVCNGITAGFGDESNISFRPEPYGNDPSHKWRWAEQWLQHGSWLMLAIASSM